MVDNLRRKKLLQALETTRKEVLPEESGSIDTGEGTTYSQGSGGAGFRNLIEKNFNKEFPDDQDVIDTSKKNMLKRMEERKAKEELIQEGYNPFGPMASSGNRQLRSPASEVDQVQDTQENTGRITDIQAQESNKPSPRQEKNISNVQGDMMVGASHALLGLLSGNYNRAAMEYGKGTEYLAGQRKQDLTDMSKLVKTVGPGGKPIYTPTIEAADMQAYEAPKAGGGAAGSFQLAQMYDPDSNRYFTVRHNSRTGEMLDMSGAPITPPANSIVRPIAPKIFQAEDVGGTKMAKEYNPYKGQSQVKVISREEGLGPAYGVKTKGQAEQIEKGYGKAQEEYQQISGSIVDTDNSLKILKTSKDPRQISGAIYTAARSVEPKGTFTDQDFKVITGDDYRSWIKNINETLQTKGAGEITALRDSFVPMVENIKLKMQQRLASIPERYAPGTSVGQKGLKSVVPGLSEKGKKNASKKVWGSKYGF